MSISDDYTVPPVVQGLTTLQLQARYNSLQQAIFDLAAGGKAVTVSYAQGDGSKSVTYTQADMAAMAVLLRYLGQALGLNSRRRAIPVMFR